MEIVFENQSGAIGCSPKIQKNTPVAITKQKDFFIDCVNCGSTFSYTFTMVEEQIGKSRFGRYSTFSINCPTCKTSHRHK